MVLRTVTLSLQGKSRNNNEDSSFVDANLQLMVVADGMGGYEAGEVASSMAVEGFVKSLKEIIRTSNDEQKKAVAAADEENTLELPTFNPEEALRSAAYYVNDLIYSYSQTKTKFQNMGSTLTAAWLIENTLYIAHIGDSRAYFLGEAARQLTIDHSVVNQLLREGGITVEEAKDHPKKHVLTRALGAEPRVEVDIYKYPWSAENILLLCSDGLSNMLNLEEILPKIDVNKDKTEILAALVQMAEAAGSQDDITGVLAWEKPLEKAKENPLETPRTELQKQPQDNALTENNKEVPA